MPVELDVTYADSDGPTADYTCTYLPEELAALATLANMLPDKFPLASCNMVSYVCTPSADFCVDDFATTNNVTSIIGNVLDNDATGLTVSRVKGLEAFVGVAVNGSNGGRFTINADGTWTFDPEDDFDLLIADTNNDTTYVTYHATDGVDESSARLVITVTGTLVGVYYLSNPVFYDGEPIYVL